MDLFSIWHWLIVAVIVLLLFGKGKISDAMGDVAQGIKAFKKGMAEDDGPKPTVLDATKANDRPDSGGLRSNDAERHKEDVDA